MIFLLNDYLFCYSTNSKILTAWRKYKHLYYMNIIIDAYNLIKQIFMKDRVSDKERQWVIARLSEYALRKKHSIYLVFDAGPYERPTVERRGEIVKVFSGRNETADDVIKSYIEEQVLNPMLIVSTDRQITNFAKRHQTPTIDSLDFYKLMVEEEKGTVKQGFQKAPGRAQKLHEEEYSPNIDALMQEASQILYYKEEDQKAEKESAEQKSSKKERQMAHIIKKL